MVRRLAFVSMVLFGGSAFAAEPSPAATPTTAETPAATPAAAATSTPAPEGSQTMFLRDRSVLNGQIVEQKDGTITFRTSIGVLTFEQNSVLRIDYVPEASSILAPESTGIAATPAGAPLTGRALRDRDQMFFIGGVWAGGRLLTKSDWGVIDRQNAYGIQTNFAFPHRWEVGPGSLAFAVDFDSSTVTAYAFDPNGDAIKYTGTISEVDTGVRWFAYDEGLVRPYVGAGFAENFASERAVDTANGTELSSISGNGVGTWIQTGAFVRLLGHLNVGADVRYTNASVHMNENFGSVSVNAGGVQVGALVSVALGAASSYP